MAMALRQAAKRMSRSLAEGAQHQQKRFAGDLPVKPNKFVEELATRRENIEHEFKWTAKNLTNLVLFAGVVPYVIYKYAVNEFDNADATYGRPARDMWGSSK